MKLSMNEIMLMNALQQVTGVMPKDCLIEETVISFFIPEQLMGKAIGKAAINVKELQTKLNKRVEFVPYFQKAEDVFASAMEVNFNSAKVNGGKLILNLDSASRSKAFKNNSRIKRVKEFILRNYNLELVIN
jgi:transcription antitermination factor NusA-like protein